MGIKFHCPNGHKMNVKSFLAGKKGVCPKCGVGVEVPLVSETEAVPSSTPANGAAPASQSNAAAPASPAFADTIVDEQEVPSFGPAAAAELATDFPSSHAVASANGKTGFKSAVLPAVIAQDPLAIWYTCTKSGDRYGPVSGEGINKWLGEGRIGADSLVWREGWPEWQKASAVFPSLKPAGAVEDFSDMFPGLVTSTPVAAPAAPQAKVDDLLADVLAGTAVASTSYIPSSSRRRTYKDKVVLASMVLIGATILLAITLLLVLLNR
jgi:hypothetical protein